MPCLKALATRNRRKDKNVDNKRVTVACPYEIFKRSSGSAEDSAIDRILKKYTSDDHLIAPVENNAFWSAEYFGLAKSTLFNSLAPDRKTQILESLSLGILEEAQFIELAGMSFTAKMSLLSEDQRQRQLYSFFAADEARHYRLINSIIGEPKAETLNNNSFLKYLGDVIQNESRLPLMFLSQVILEGWGLTHYTNLSENAQSEKVTVILKSIVADEARHHGSGVVMFSENSMTKAELESVDSWLHQFLEMIRIGPYSVIATLRAHADGLSESQIQQYLVETGFETKIRSDLEIMKTLMRKSGAENLMASATRKNLFVIPSVAETAQKIAGSF